MSSNNPAVLSADNEARLQSVLTETLGVTAADLTDDASPQTIPTWTSLNHLSLMAAVEETFGVTFSMEEMGAAGESLAHLRTFLASHLAS
ncbi:MAG: acyl carrier protein [Armatimonadota bacterium]